MSPESTPLDSLRRAAEELAVEVSSLVPRLVERSRDQLSVAMSFAERLPCAGWFGVGPDAAPTRPDLRVVDSHFDDDFGDDDDEDDLWPSSPPPRTAADTTAPAKKAAAKKAPAKKAVAKKAPAKKAPAKKAPAKKAAAKKAPAKKAAPARAVAPLANLPQPAPATTDDGLAVPDYDELAASQVIPRLDSLSPAELESIRLHEVSHRSRRTILSRIAQIQAG